MGLAWSLQATAQYAGDDEGILMQKAARRDSAAIAEAVDGWWTASMAGHDQRIAWWREARFGCFIHWGVYSVPGGLWKGKKVGGYAEHLMRKEKISRAEYAEQLLKPFNPTGFDAETWVKTIRDAGMKYLIITAKHHDGVAMYPSAIGDYTLRQSAFQRDPMQELADACRKYGIRFGFYYSHAFDWEHPDAPGNDWDYNNPGGDKNLFGGTNWYDHHPELLPKAVKYVNEKSVPQIKELLQRYHPDILWFDTPHKLPLSENIRILRAIRETDTAVVVNGRLARSAAVSFGDYKNTADRPAAFYPVEGDWEAIPTTNESYGYSRFDESHKPPAFFIRLLSKAAARNGNLLMNIGPMGNGVIDPRDVRIIKAIGEWLETNGESIYGSQPSPLPVQSWGEVTRKGNRLYLHVFQAPPGGGLIVAGLRSEIGKATMLADGKELKTVRTRPEDVMIRLDGTLKDTAATVIALDVKGEMRTGDHRLLEPRVPQTFHAFDAELHGQGWSYGDGKAGKDYAQQWNNGSQFLTWKIRQKATAKYKVVLRFAEDAPPRGTRFRLSADNTLLEGTPGPGGELGEVELRDGTTAELKLELLQPGETPLKFRQMEWRLPG
ncbi:alpha-L-fucosidase [Chitinophaga sp. NPDC101104]|uniref:alpha-L-fucosidase n=1 Tax=Chitinophaga sp. NPDC101104 TaxID=3390561 RepID=UPI003D095330